MNNRIANSLITAWLGLLISGPVTATTALLRDGEHTVWWSDRHCAPATDVRIRSLRGDNLLNRPAILESLVRTAAVAISFQCQQLQHLSYEVIDAETDEFLHAGSVARDNDWRIQTLDEIDSADSIGQSADGYGGQNRFRVAGIELGMSMEAARSIMREQFGERPGYFPDRGLLVIRQDNCRPREQRNSGQTDAVEGDIAVHNRCLRVWLSADAKPVVQRVVLVHELSRDLGHDVDEALQQRFGPARKQSPIYDPQGHGYHITKAYRLDWGLPLHDGSELEADIIERVDATRVVLRLGGTGLNVSHYR